MQISFLHSKENPQNLIDKNILNSCKHIILDSGSATTAAELNLLVDNALEEGVPSDRFVMAVSTISYDTTDKKTGYWDGTRCIGRGSLLGHCRGCWI